MIDYFRMFVDLVDNLLQNWPYIAAAGLILAGVVFMIIVMVVQGRSYERYCRNLDDATNSQTIFIIDLNKEQAKYFNITSIGQVQTCTLSEFYSRFPIEQQKTVINWVNSVSDQDLETPNFLEVDFNDHANHRQYFSMLQLNSIDYKKRILHLDLYLLKYMNSGKEASQSDHEHGLSSYKKITSAIKSSNRRKGVTFVYYFSYKKLQNKEKVIDPLIFGQLKNALFPFTGANSHRYLMQCSGNSLLLTDLHAADRPEATYLARSSISAINRYLSLNGYLSSIAVFVGGVEHRHINGSAETIIDLARKMGNDANASSTSLLWYRKGSEAINIPSDSYRTEVERIIHDNKISVSFRPIYSITKDNIMGYFASSKPKDTQFSDMEELYGYAYRTDDNRQLFATIVRNTLPLFVQENRIAGALLFYPVHVEDRAHMLVTFGHYSYAKEANVVFLFREDDVRAHFDPNDPDNIVENMRQIRAKGYEVALFMDSGELNLPATLYTAFDFFVCGFAFAGGAANMDSLIRSQLHALVEKLLKYGKPIIATDIKGWDSIELLVRSGLKYISSEDFAPYDSMLNPPSQKALKRIRDIRR